jgi:hypothetical protein
MAEGMKQNGPISTPMQWIPGNPSDHSGADSTIHNGVPGYPAGTGGKLPEVTFSNTDGFADPKPASRG